MRLALPLWPVLRQSLKTYWLLARIMIPVAIGVEAMARTGLIEKIAPVFGPVMELVGLPPQLGLAWLTGLLVGIWAALPLVFSLVPVAQLSVADVTVFSALLLVAHGLPVEQQIIRLAGPRILITTLLRLVGALIFAFAIRQISNATGVLSQPVDPAWIPMGQNQGWLDFMWALGETMLFMLIFLVLLSFALEMLKATGILDIAMTALAPLLKPAGMSRETGHLTAIGLFLGISYGGAFLVQESRSGALPSRQVFLSCVFMGFAHSIVEDTMILLTIGADLIAILLGRILFAIVATAMIAALLRLMPDRLFYKMLFRDNARDFKPLTRSRADL